MSVLSTWIPRRYDILKPFIMDQCQFALIEVIALENKSAITSRRAKFVFISWVGLETPIIERAKVSTISAQVREFFVVCATC